MSSLCENWLSQKILLFSLILVEEQLMFQAKSNFWNDFFRAASVANSFKIKYVTPALAGPVVFFVGTYEKFGSTSFFHYIIFFLLMFFMMFVLYCKWSEAPLRLCVIKFSWKSRSLT